MKSGSVASITSRSNDRSLELSVVNVINNLVDSEYKEHIIDSLTL
tara:strand:+ start:264 stop:398 length:135 start_codon:yes stop_codon:yes gene_type:complete